VVVTVGVWYLAIAIMYGGRSVATATVRIRGVADDKKY